MKNFLQTLKILLSFFFSFSISLTIPFKSFSNPSENFLSSNFYTNIYSPFQIGSQQQNLPCSIILQRSDFYVNSENFNANQSKSYVQISNENKYNYKFISSKDDFKLNSKTIAKQINFDYLIEITTSNFNAKECQIGFQLENSNENKNIFIKILKEKKIIKNYVFFIKFNNFYEGNFYIGNFPHEKLNFDIENFRSTKVLNENNFLYWGIQFENIQMNNEKIIDSNKIFFSFEFGLIIATKMSEKIISKNLFNLKNCFLEEFSINEEFFGECKYNSYYCDLNTNIKNFPDLEFFNKEINFTFKLNYEDLFVKKNDRFQFLIIFEQYEKNNRWKIGKIFFQKFLMIFDYDKKQIGFYIKNGKNNNNNNNFFINFIKIFFVCFCFFFIFGVFYYFFIKKKHRKIQANELEENYEYKTKNYSKLIN